MGFKKLLFLLFICILIKMPCSAGQSASASLGATLPLALTIDGFLVNGVDYPCGGTAPLIIESKTVVNPSLYVLGLTPVKVKVKSNCGNFLLSGEFISLSKIDYIFPTSALSLNPTSQTFTNPSHPIQISDNFTPSVQVTSNAKAGEYSGILIFTVSLP